MWHATLWQSTTRQCSFQLCPVSILQGWSCWRCQGGHHWSLSLIHMENSFFLDKFWKRMLQGVCTFEIGHTEMSTRDSFPRLTNEEKLDQTLTMLAHPGNWMHTVVDRKKSIEWVQNSPLPAGWFLEGKVKTKWNHFSGKWGAPLNSVCSITWVQTMIAHVTRWHCPLIFNLPVSFCNVGTWPTKYFIQKKMIEAHEVPSICFACCFCHKATEKSKFWHLKMEKLVFVHATATVGKGKFMLRQFQHSPQDVWWPHIQLTCKIGLTMLFPHIVVQPLFQSLCPVQSVGTKQFPWMKCFTTDWGLAEQWQMVSLLALTWWQRSGSNPDPRSFQHCHATPAWRKLECP